MSDTAFVHTVPLNRFTLLRVEGPDSERFLQGQLTCDVTALTDGQWTLGACCNAKGRMIANFVLARTAAEHYILRLPAGQTEALQQHLSRYAVFYKTAMNTDTGTAVSGRLPASPSPALLAAPQPVRSDNGSLILSWPDGREEIWGANTASGDETLWHQQDIRQGLVWVQEASREAWVPQYIDWQLQGGISFSKGCYTGQEIVARLQYLGKAKKRLALVSADSALQPALLTDVTNAAGKSIGEIAAWEDSQGLAVISSEMPQSAQIGEKTVKLCALFYTEGNDGEETPPTAE